MIKCDKDLLLCDLAETYHIFNINELSLTTIARFSVGLRDNSRIKMKMANVNYDFKDTVLMGILDRLSILAWQNTRDAQKGKNKPSSLLEKLLNIEKSNEITAFASSEDFETARNELLKKGG